MPFVELVQHHGIDARKLWIANQTPSQDSFREETETRSRTGHFLEAHLIADSFADRLGHLLSHSSRGHAYGQTPRLQHQHVAAHQIEQGRRNARGFSRARRRFDY